MSLARLLIAATALTIVAHPASARAEQGGGHTRSGSEGARAAAPSGGGHAVARTAPAPRVTTAPRGAYTQSRPLLESRSLYQSRGVAVPRGPDPRVVGSRGLGPRVVGQRYPGRRVVGRPVYIAPFRYARPYYSFRPRFSVGFGLWAGFPVSYPYYYPVAYPYPYGYSYPYSYPYGSPYPYAYPPPSYGYPPASYPAYGYPQSDPQSYPQGYPPQASVGVQPGATPSGGVSFEITPGTAEIYVDGRLEGPIENFTPSSSPLSLTPGRHRIEIRAPGYQTLTFDADVVAGQVIPYRGTLQPIR